MKGIPMSEISLRGESPAGQSPFDTIRQLRADGSEFWSARDLAPVMGYSRWDHFEIPIKRAMKASENQGHDVAQHFPGSRKVAASGPAAQDFELTRFAAYLVAMNGDPNKPEVAAAQAYFAIQTRVAETAKPALAGAELLAHAVLEAQQMLASKDKEIAALDKHIAELAPKAEYVDEFVTDEDVLRFATVASTVGLKESGLRDLLIDKKWIFCETASRWSRTQDRKITVNRYSEYADKKAYFQRIENHDAPRFRGEVMHTHKITPAGATAIARLVRRNSTVVDLFTTNEDGAA